MYPVNPVENTKVSLFALNEQGTGWVCKILSSPKGAEFQAGSYVDIPLRCFPMEQQGLLFEGLVVGLKYNAYWSPVCIFNFVHDRQIKEKKQAKALALAEAAIEDIIDDSWGLNRKRSGGWELLGWFLLTVVVVAIALYLT